MKKIIIQGKEILLNNNDYEYLKHFKWKVIKKGNDQYACIRKMKGIGKEMTTIYMHEFLIDIENQNCIGFRNKNTLDNRRENLFSIPKGFSIQRTRKRQTVQGKMTTSKYKGVTRRIKRGKIIWEVRICKDKKTYYLGSYKTQKQASLAYNKKAIELYGDNAYVNS